jgi:hypothetical protein
MIRKYGIKTKNQLNKDRSSVYIFSNGIDPISYCLDIELNPVSTYLPIVIVL